MSVVRTLAWCFHILELSSIHTGEHIKAQSADRSHRTTAYHCYHSFFRWKVREVFIPSWMILDHRFLESTTPYRLLLFFRALAGAKPWLSQSYARLFLHGQASFKMGLMASPCSWSWFKVLTSISWCPVCCRDMFHKDLSTATESTASLSTVREMMYFTKRN